MKATRIQYRQKRKYQSRYVTWTVYKIGDKEYQVGGTMKLNGKLVDISLRNLKKKYPGLEVKSSRTITLNF